MYVAVPPVKIHTICLRVSHSLMHHAPDPTTEAGSVLGCRRDRPLGNHRFHYCLTVGLASPASDPTVSTTHPQTEAGGGGAIKGYNGL